MNQNEEKPVPREVLADSIRKIADGASRLQKSGLNKKAIIVLLVNSSRVSHRDVKAVLEALENLAKEFCS